MLENYKNTIGRIGNLLPEQKNVGEVFDYSDNEIDAIRAYYLLVHAEIETYIESCISDIVNKSYNNWKSNKVADLTMLALVVYCHPAIRSENENKNISELKKGEMYLIELCKRNFDGRLTRNHGIKSNHIEDMLKICRFDLELNTDFLPSLDSFSSTRGEYAHNSYRNSCSTPDDAKKSVAQIIEQLDILEAHRITLIG